MREAGPRRSRGASFPVLEIGGTHVTAALVADGTVTRAIRSPLDASLGVDELVDALVAAADGVTVTEGSAWGIALPGPFDVDSGVAGYADDKFASLYGVNLGALLRARLGGSITFVNDGDAFALGEWSRRAGGCQRLVGLTLGTGVGSGWIDGGRVVLEGDGVPPTGSAHLIQWDGAPLENTFSRRALIAASGARDVLDLCLAARAGDEAARRVLRAATTALGRALAPHLTAFRADTVVVGGSIAGSWDLLGPWFADGAGIEAQVAADDRAAMIGAALAAAREAGTAPGGLPAR